MQSTEEGLQQVDELVQTYKHSCSWFFGPFYHLVRVFHPDYVKPLLMASGTNKTTQKTRDYSILSAAHTDILFPFLEANITVKDELIYGHLRPWLGESDTSYNKKKTECNHYYPLFYFPKLSASYSFLS